METIKTEAFELALKFINETNVNIFLTGKAGTGKTTFLKYLKENPVKNMAVACLLYTSTGIRWNSSLWRQSDF